MDDIAPLPRRRTRSGKSLSLALGLATITAASVLWLTAAGELAATGTRIARLETERAGLAQRRSAALVAHAVASDPRRLEQRAVELGFRPATRLTFLPVQEPAASGPKDATLRSPLRLLQSGARAATPTQPMAEAAPGLDPAGGPHPPAGSAMAHAGTDG